MANTTKLPDPLRSSIAKQREAHKRIVALNDGWHCIRCGHNWLPRDRMSENALRFQQDTVYHGIEFRAGQLMPPTRCPRCKSLAWNREYVGKSKSSDRRWREAGTARVMEPMARRFDKPPARIECSYCGEKAATLEAVEHKPDCQVLAFRSASRLKREKAEKLAAALEPAALEPTPPLPPPPQPPPPPPPPAGKRKPLGDWTDYGPKLDDSA